MNTALWIVQGLLSVAMLLAGGMRVVVPKPTLEKRMLWARTWTSWRIKVLGLAEVAGAIGVVVPFATGTAPALTPIAAACLAVLMAGAVATNQRIGASIIASLILCVLCIVVAVGRGMELAA